MKLDLSPKECVAGPLEIVKDTHGTVTGYLGLP